MSGYASKAELLDTIRRTITSDYNRQSEHGLPTDLEAYNFAGICRDLRVGGDSYNGWRYDYSAPPMLEILAKNLRTRIRCTDSRGSFCAKCHATIRQIDTDGGLWLTDCEGGKYDCGAGGLHEQGETVWEVAS